MAEHDDEFDWQGFSQAIMSEQIMWAVKAKDGRILWMHLHATENDAQQWFARDNWPAAAQAGYRCIRVKVTEVGDA